MITILEWIDLEHHQLGWATADVGDGVGGDSAAVQQMLNVLGIHYAVSTGERPARVLDHQWRVEGDRIHYDARFLGTEREPSGIAFYVGAVLATAGVGEPDALRELRLALYEILVNVYEHGRTLPGMEPAFRLRLRIGDGEIEGIIEDGCEEFVPEVPTPIDLDARVRNRASRGYGVTLIQRTLDSVRYEFGKNGNTIHFRKEVTSCRAS